MSDRSTKIILQNTSGVSVNPATEDTLSSVLTAIGLIATSGYPDTIAHGSKVVTTAGTQVQLNSLIAKKGFAYIKAKPTNTGNIYVGGSTIDNTSIAISPGKYAPIPLIDDISKIWIDSDVNGEGVNFTIYYIA